MKTLQLATLTFVLAMLLSVSLRAQNDGDSQPTFRNGVMYLTDQTGPHTLSLEVLKLKSNDGKVMLTLMTDEQVPIAQTQGAILDKTSVMLIDSLPSGTYVVRYYHDENGNGQLDTGMMGIPTEGYGSSNDARGFMGPPEFEDMIFELMEDLSMKMKTVN